MTIWVVIESDRGFGARVIGTFSSLERQKK
jgi:hypothetical protein